MTFKILLSATALAVLPTLGFAQDCSYGKTQQVMSCSDGTTWDAATATCVPITTS